MHMSSQHAAEVILEGDRSLMGTNLWNLLNPSKWPISSKALPTGSALVGGAIRDALLNRQKQYPDLDFVLPTGTLELAEKLAKELNGKYLILDKKRNIARLVINNWTIDFAQMEGNSLEEDLLRRDFKINAIALTLGKKPEIIDPTEGLSDIQNKELVAICEQNLIDDPLRCLRALRLMGELNFHLEAQTNKWIESHAHMLSLVSPERIHFELQQLVKSPWADEALATLQQIGLLKKWQTSTKEAPKNLPSQKKAHALSTEEKAKALPLARLAYLLSQSRM